MSIRQTRAIVQALLQDDTLGLRATVERLAVTLPNPPTGNPGPLSSDFVFYRGALPGAIRPLTAGNILLQSRRWVTNTRSIAVNQREGLVSLEIRYETASASHEDLQDQVELVASALMQCLDVLVDYSDANKAHFGTVIADVEPNVDFSLGDFEGATTSGFIARVTVQELSRDD